MPATTSKSLSTSTFEVCLGDACIPVGQLKYVVQGRRELAQFSYHASWLDHPARFEISPDLPLQAGFFSRKAPGDRESPFFFALADTEPDAWGRQVIDRAHAKARKKDASLGPLREVDYLCADPSKARGLLAWEPTVTFPELIQIMVEADLKYVESQIKGGSEALQLAIAAEGRRS